MISVVWRTPRNWLSLSIAVGREPDFASAPLGIVGDEPESQHQLAAAVNLRDFARLKRNPAPSNNGVGSN